MFRNLAEHPVTWSLYEESQEIFYRHYPIDPEVGDRIVEDPTPEVAAQVIEDFYRQAHNKEAFTEHPLLRLVPRKALQRPMNVLYKRPPLRLVEKTPANSLRIPFLARLFPDARFIFLLRRAEDVISSLMQGWKRWSHTGAGEWTYNGWHYIVPPGWRDWRDRSLQEICAFQWMESIRIAWDDLNEHCQDRFLLARHEEAILDPIDTYNRILEFCELPPSSHFDAQLVKADKRVFTHGGTKPRHDKWRDLHEREVESVRHLFQPLMDEFYPREETERDA